MNEDTLNMEIRKFLKKVGITSQREIEQGVYHAIESKQLQGNELLDVSMTLDLPVLNISHRIEGKIKLV